MLLTTNPRPTAHRVFRPLGTKPPPTSVIRIADGVATVCDWHANHREGRDWAMAQGYEVQPSVCPACHSAFITECED